MYDHTTSLELSPSLVLQFGTHAALYLELVVPHYTFVWRDAATVADLSEQGWAVETRAWSVTWMPEVRLGARF